MFSVRCKHLAESGSQSLRRPFGRVGVEGGRTESHLSGPAVHDLCHMFHLGGPARERALRAAGDITLFMPRVPWGTAGPFGRGDLISRPLHATAAELLRRRLDPHR
jgi:hypothetical protein